MTYLFSGLGIIMGIALVVSLCLGEFNELNIHLAAYGFILAGLGYLIELIKKREKNVDVTLEYIIEKKMENITKEIKSVRMTMLKLDERRIQNDEEKPPKSRYKTTGAKD